MWNGICIGKKKEPASVLAMDDQSFANQLTLENKRELPLYYVIGLYYNVPARLHE